MNVHQEHLLELLKEVDAFCKEHQITYYCAGGTVIGAARHKGFIPWDDDIDIYMTRENFARFADALEKYGPKDRKLEYYEADHDRRAPVPRYHRDTDTLFCHFHLLGRSCAGTSLDVFILDPIPDDHEGRIDYISKLYAYCDLVAPCHVYSHRLPTSKFDVYDTYKRIADEQGVPRAVEMISDEIFHYETSECGCYCLRWGSVILIYPVEVIGEPTYLTFEDMMIPVPQDWYRYLVIHYGMDWVDLPYEEAQHEHTTILRYDMRYDYLYEKRDELFSQDELLDLHFKWKDAERDLYRTAEPIEAFVKETQDLICRAEITNRLRKALEETGLELKETGVAPLEALFEAGEYVRIKDIYAPYLDLQLSHAYMGRQMRHGTQFRWIFPFITPLDESEMGVLLNSLLRIGQQRTVEKIIGIYNRAGVRAVAVKKASKVVDVINDARRAFYLGDYDKALGIIDGSGLKKDSSALSDLFWLAKAQTSITDEEASELETAVAAEGRSEYLRKAWGDHLWKSGKHTEAESIYRDLMQSCRNGLFWLDIQSKLPDIEPIPTKRLTPFTDTDLTGKQKKLLEEIAEICDRNGIRYVIGPDLARRMYLTGNIGYVNSNREIFMDAENSEKFIKAINNSDMINRRLLTRKNSSKVRDMAMLYCDTKSVYCDFRNLEKWKDIGICITIRILGSGSGLAGLKCKLLGRDAAPIKKGDLYHYTNVKGKRPVKHAFSRPLWENTCTLEMDGASYLIPAEMTAKTVQQETDLSNVPPINSVFNYRSNEMSWEEIDPLIDDAAYNALDWAGYLETRKKYREIDEKVRKIWQTMLDIGNQ